jgi:hypothetical protein
MARKEQLVVIGNGMAGARFVEEVIAGGGADLFDIVDSARNLTATTTGFSSPLSWLAHIDLKTSSFIPFPGTNRMESSSTLGSGPAGLTASANRSMPRAAWWSHTTSWSLALAVVPTCRR